MKIGFLITTLAVGLSLSGLTPKVCFAVQEPEKVSDLADSGLENQEVVQPEEIPAIFGFDGGLRIMGTSASGDGFKTTVQERTQEGELVRSAVVTQDSDEVRIKVTRQFGVDQRDQLIEAFPQLTEEIGGFPRDVDDLEIELSVGIARTFSAKNVEEFAEKYPTIFRHYRRHLHGGRDVKRDIGFAIRKPIVRPEVRGAPMPRAGERMAERLEGMVEETAQRLETANVQVKLLEEALAVKTKELGKDHKSVARAESAVVAAQKEADALKERLAALKKSNELRKLDKQQLDKITPQRKKSDDN